MQPLSLLGNVEVKLDPEERSFRRAHNPTFKFKREALERVDQLRATRFRRSFEHGSLAVALLQLPRDEP